MIGSTRVGHGGGHQPPAPSASRTPSSGRAVHSQRHPGHHEHRTCPVGTRRSSTRASGCGTRPPADQLRTCSPRSAHAPSTRGGTVSRGFASPGFGDSPRWTPRSFFRNHSRRGGVPRHPRGPLAPHHGHRGGGTGTASAVPRGWCTRRMTSAPRQRKGRAGQRRGRSRSAKQPLGSCLPRFQAADISAFRGSIPTRGRTHRCAPGRGPAGGKPAS